MLATANHWTSLDAHNKTKYLIQLGGDHSNCSVSSKESGFEWISLSLISIIILTIVGNSLVCIAVVRERRLRNTTNLFLTSLAITDCLVACLVMAVAVGTEFYGYFPFNALACNIWSTFDICCCTASIWHMSAMSLDRYLTLRYPLKYGRNKRRSLMACKILTIWLISFAICLPIFILSLLDSSNVYNEETCVCFPSNRIFKLYGSFVAFLIPLIIMIATYTLTIISLRKVCTTKKRSKERKEMRAVIDAAAIAIKWKRAINSVEIPHEQKSSIVPEQEIQLLDKKISIYYERQRTSSLGTDESSRNLMFTSSQRLNATSKFPSSIDRARYEDKQLNLLQEKFTEQLSDQHLNLDFSPNTQIHAQRSRSCTPVLDVETNRKCQRRGSFVHTLLQIRRESAKISKDLANLTARLNSTMNTDDSASTQSPRSIHGVSGFDRNRALTLGQLLAETSVDQPIIIPASLLSFDRKKCGRSHSADIRLPIFGSNEYKTVTNNTPTPNLLVTNENIHKLPTNNPKQSRARLKFDKKCQRIKDWISITSSSSTALNTEHNSTISTRCASAVNATENMPGLNVNQHPASSLKKLGKYFDSIEHLHGQTSVTNSISHHHQCLMCDNRTAPTHRIATAQQSSICSVLSSRTKARHQHNRLSTSSSLESTFQQGSIGQHSPRPHDGMSQTSFQTVPLDTDDSSSHTSSITQHSANLQSVVGGNNNPTSPATRRIRQRFKRRAKNFEGNERKAMRVLLIIFSVFVILWTPFFVMNLLSCFITNIHPIFISAATWLGFLSSGANPFIYTIFSRTFRRAFVNILTCQKVIHSRPMSTG